jgi:hypothetical protein
MSTDRGEALAPYPELLAVPTLLGWTRDVLAAYGFAERTSLPLVSVCRDELMFGFVDAVTAHWGHCFDLSSLAGLPLMGRTGLGAALGHAPDDDGRHRLVVFAFPHIGADGGMGAVHRPGVPGTTSACGAVDIARNALLAGVSGVVLDPHDVEESLLVQRLRRVLGDAPVPSLPEVTELVRRAAVGELTLLLGGLSTAEVVVDWALVSGVVVHGHDEDAVSVSSATVVVDGVAKDLTLPSSD